MYVHLTTWYKLEVGTGLIQFLDVEKSMGERIHVTVIGQTPTVHPILPNEIDVILWIIQPVKRRKPIMSVKTDEARGTLYFCHIKPVIYTSLL